MAGRGEGLPSRPRREVAADHLERYLATTAAALAKVRVAAPERSHHHRLASDFLDMARSYYGDALHFRDAGDLVNALSCVNYAHGWLDAGARLGLFDVGGDDRLFTLAE
ncbi:MAG TPA: DUF357 domain-containing protein [Candidatus Thermoplasmatota archaeon]